MAYIQPNSTIEFFSDLNLSDKYTDSLYFASVSAKDTYFTNLTKVARVLTCTYTRENRGFVRVEVPMATLIGASYMRFKNTSFENKWFYAFVKNVNYINNQTTEVRFELDPLMTWMGTFTLNECYIERQHTLRDGIGNNIAEEGLPTGEYIVEHRELLKVFTNMSAVMAYGHETKPETQTQAYGNIPSALTHYGVLPNVGNITEKVLNLIGANQIDSLQSITLQPSEYVGQLGDLESSTTTHTGGTSLQKPYSDFDGYVPRNNKLFCYPYKFCTVETDEGGSQDYLYEYMGANPDATSPAMMGFNWTGCSYPTGCEVMLEPNNYKGSAGLEHRLSISHFPQIPWACDQYEAYLAQKNAYLEQDIAKSILGVGTSMALGSATAGLQAERQFGNEWFTDTQDYLNKLHNLSSSPVYGATMGMVGSLPNVSNTIAGNMIENAVRPASPMIPKGSSTVDLMFSRGYKGFILYEKCITKNYAMMIDSYFDMFGYAVKQHGVPNMNARPNWTFVKTIGCNVGGAIPADDATAIESIFDNGIRFWKNHNNIGNYSLNNAPST